MMTDRDNFTAKTKRILGERVGYRCSCPTCRRLTIGPTKDISAPLLIAEAAHITGASAGGPRFDQRLTPEERRAVENGIWLCAACHTMVDKDRNHFTDQLLREWKTAGEELARREVEGELIFSGYTDPAKKADQHFKSQLQGFVGTHAEMGKEGAANQTTIAVPIVFLQMVSISSLKELVKLAPAQMKPLMSDIKPVVCSSWGTEVSRFGVHVAGYGAPNRSLKSLVQLLKDGSLAMGFVFEQTNAAQFGSDYSKSKTIPWMAIENGIFTSIGQGVDLLKRLQLQPPAFARLVVTNVKGYGMAFDPGNWIQHDPANVDVVETAPTSVASLDLPPTEIARPLLEEFWQHFGVWHSPSYDEKGEFIRNR